MTPEERRKTYPPYIVRETEKEDPPGFVLTKITDFLPLLRAIWKISNKPYQKEYWGKPGQWGDNYMETMETFLGDAEGVLDTTDRTIEMTPKQREMLQKLYDMMEDYEADPNSADDPGYGVNDAAIIEDPLFAKCREYAKLVYEELSGDDLEAWEKSRSE